MPTNSRLDNLAAWVAASVVVTAGVIFALKQDDSRGFTKPVKQGGVIPRATPAQEPLRLQEIRAAERGRGRKARSPSQIPWRGWKDIILRTFQESQDDRLLALAAEVVFYSLLALFPAIAAGVSFYALFTDAGTIARHLSLLAGVVPADVLDVLRDEITLIAAKSDGRLTFGFLVGFCIALWSANAGMKSMFDALNVIYDEQEARGLIRLNLISLFFTVCGIGAVLLAVSAVVVFPLLWAWFGLAAHAELLGYLRWPLMCILIMAATAVLYRYGPSRRPAKWRWISLGSVFAAVAWLTISSLFSWYLANFANYNATYGALGAIVGLMMWMWLSAIVILVGAELNSEIEHQTARDSTVGVEKPLGRRGAVMADTVGAAKSGAAEGGEISKIGEGSSYPLPLEADLE
ncbi:MAG TPA: YihY/virulence factor BrkB family protein [Xanthobacteraceae bacterium]|nr:YihY/virulence factor BrkB family protein [Xanthobacteraceae bacterium]